MKTDNKTGRFAFASILFLFSFFGIADLPAEQLANDPDSRKRVQSGSRMFSVHDIDKDGLLSKEEYRIFIEQIELRRRANGRNRRHYPPPLRFEEIDIDDNGYLTEDEMISTLNKRLQQHRRYRYQGGRER